MGHRATPGLRAAGGTPLLTSIPSFFAHPGFSAGLAALVLALIPPVFARALPDGAVLTTAQEVRLLGTEEARRQHPVRLRGVVTDNDPAAVLSFVQDGSAGIFVPINVSGSDVRTFEPGSLVEVAGVTSVGSFSPLIAVPGGSGLPRTVVLEDFESYTNSAQMAKAWYKPHRGGEVARVLDTAVHGGGRRSCRLEYRTAADPLTHYGAVCRVSKWDAAGCDTARFWLKPEGSGHQPRLQARRACRDQLLYREPCRCARRRRPLHRRHRGPVRIFHVGLVPPVRRRPPWALMMRNT